MEIKKMSMDLAGREFTITNSPINTAATGYAVVSLGDTVVLGTATISEKGKEGAAWFPMVVDYVENMYAAGKIKGSRFIKRGGRPSEKSVLTSRLIDRPIRPLFPKGTTNEVQIICSALSIDMEVDPATTAMNAASVALLTSGAPFAGPIGAVRVGYLNGELIINPTYEQIEEGDLNLVVAGTLEAITMVEAAAKEVTEDVVLEALDLAHKYIKEICEFQLKYVEGMEIEKIEADIPEGNTELIDAIKSSLTSQDLDGISGLTKKEVKKKIHALEEKMFEKYEKELDEDIFTEGEIKDTINDLFEKNMRKNILEKGERIDGRKVTEIRPLNIIPDVLPRTHGSAIFQRGETQALTITTLGSPGSAQIVDIMEYDETKRYFHHYNFPPYSVGDIKPLRGPGRRDIGHGDLAERALIPVLPKKEDFSYTIWAMSEIMQCNGSSSMASVCGSSLSLMAAGVPIKEHVAGIAMGLVINKENPSQYQILSDIQGLEDFAGDMDFKVTGTRTGITALQMDIKVKGLSKELMKEAMTQALEGRNFILDKMYTAIPEPRTQMSKYAPSIISHKIDPDKIRWVIGKGGETINKIIDECNVEIDIDDDGLVSITAQNQEDGHKALAWVKKLTYEPKVGDVIDGKVVKILDFGAMVELAPGKDGLIHISKLANYRVNKVTDIVKMGDEVRVKLLEIDGQGRYNLARVIPKDEQGKGPQGGGHDKKELRHAHQEKKQHSTPTKTDPTQSPDEKQKKDWHELGERVEGTSAVRKIE